MRNVKRTEGHCHRSLGVRGLNPQIWCMRTFRTSYTSHKAKDSSCRHTSTLTMVAPSKNDCWTSLKNQKKTLIWSILFCQTNIFDQHQKVNRWNDRLLCADNSDVSKFPASLMILRVASVAVYTDVSETVVKTWVVLVCNRTAYMFQQESAFKLNDYLHDHITQKVVTAVPKSESARLLHVVVVERETNQRSHNTSDSLKAIIIWIMSTTNSDRVIRASQRIPHGSHHYSWRR